MPDVDTFDPVFAAHRYYSGPITPVPTSNVIETWKSGLTGAGWTLSSSIAASGTDYFPFGAPTYPGGGGGTSPATCANEPTFIRIGPVHFAFYSPDTSVGVSSANCVMVAKGTTALSSLTNMASAITSNTAYTCVVSGPDMAGGFTLTFTGQTAGSLLNYPSTFADGTWSASGTILINGGGYKLTSPGVTASQVTVTLTATTANDVNLHFVVSYGGFGTSTHDLAASTGTPPQIGPYYIIATENQFVIYDPSSLTDFSSRSSSLMVCAPFQTAPVTYAAFTLGNQDFRPLTSWHVVYSGEVVALDGSVNGLTGGANSYPRILCLADYINTTPLTTAIGDNVVLCAYVALGKSQNDTPGIVGKVWDAIILSDLVIDGAFVNGHSYKTVCQNDGTTDVRTSLLFRIT